MMATETTPLIADGYNGSGGETTPTAAATAEEEEEPSPDATMHTATSRELPPLAASGFPAEESIVAGNVNEMLDGVVDEVRLAIAAGIIPSRIKQGSSGSYFCRDRQGKIVGVFKPKNEEPYGKLNPKWTKWLHRTCCPCCFGRGCLIPNSGYISEGSASVVDQMLGLNVVPPTKVVKLASSAFNYGYIERNNRTNRLPEKIGSFQLFVNGYKDAYIVLKEMHDRPLSEDLANQFQLQFEKLVILDYLIRNTDRGNDNWLIKIDYSPDDDRHSSAADPENGDEHASLGEESDWDVLPKAQLRIAAIDNGLAFPFKHPDSWRAYPYGWSLLPQAKMRFSDTTRQNYLSKLIDPDFIDAMILRLREVAELDADFNEGSFHRQISVIRGQTFNLVEALVKRMSPYELVQMPCLTIRQVENRRGYRTRLLSFRLRAPTFSWC